MKSKKKEKDSADDFSKEELRGLDQAMDEAGIGESITLDEFKKLVENSKTWDEPATE